MRPSNIDPVLKEYSQYIDEFAYLSEVNWLNDYTWVWSEISPLDSPHKIIWKEMFGFFTV